MASTDEAFGLVEAQHQRPDDQRPAVHQDKEQELEGQGDDNRGSIIMPIDVSVLETTRSMFRNGMKTRKPIS
jgi:hypothetical protein